MASAQEVYLGLEPTAEAPRPNGWDAYWNSITGKYNEAYRQYDQDVKEFNAQKALTAAEWEREDTTYQRLVNDLKAAGINPYYALNQSSISPVNSSGQQTYSNKGKYQEKSKKSGTAGLLTAALLIFKLLAA